MRALGRGVVQGTLLSAAGSLLVGCALLQPKADPIAMPEPPQTRSASLVIEVEPEDPSVSDYVQPEDHVFPPQASVVINVPSSIDSRRASDQSNGPDDDSFKTRNFYSAAEERIERELIRHGFRLLSRAKFEAKLREQRDAGAACDPWYRCPERLGDELRAAVEDLERDLEADEISRAEYAEEMAELGRSNLRSAGRSRQAGEDELVDMSEVIRAAQSGAAGERADYILEVNRFNTNPDEKMTRVIDLRGHPDVRRFRNNHAWTGDLTRSQDMILRCEQQMAELNAKLVEVQSGQVVWIGSHRVTESMLAGEENTLIYEITASENVVNADRVRSFVRYQNSEPQLVARSGQPKPDVPDYEVVAALDGPVLTSGQCTINDRSQQKRAAVSTALAQEVAETLIKTIRVGGI